MKNRNELGIYIHIPFCVHKCIYCDFLSSPADDGIRKRYVKALIREICITGEGKDKGVVTSIFIGGGTPSVIDAEDIRDIINAVRQNYNVSCEAEITIECNPGTMDTHKAEVYRQSGINRISFGLQSTDNKELKLLGRIHSYEQCIESIRIARKAGFNNINIDLMSALPGQTLESFCNVLHTALSLDTEHISVYSLIIEEGTALYNNIDRYPEVPSDDEDRQIYYRTQDILRAYGYEQYEISNYSKPGYECKHNIKYWERCDYIGFGIGAASLYGNMRYTNISDINKYMDILMPDKESCIEPEDKPGKYLELKTDIEQLTKEDAMSEYMFLGLRKTKGIDEDDFGKEFGVDVRDIFAEAIEENIRNGLLIEKDNRLYLSKRGVDISNTVMSDFILDY